jgi:4,5-DOPA dioxygenase extradiol
MEEVKRMPVLFLGHGSPMNAIEENEFVQGFRQIVKSLPKPESIVCISAHWETRGTLVTAMKQPRTIHDFGGFPETLYQVQYPAPGNPLLAKEICRSLKPTDIGLDENWGLDHGAWSVIKHLYPLADVPVVQLSLDYTASPASHVVLARQLAAFREKGILIVGSGNIVHNLRLVAWDKLEIGKYAYDWAAEANEKMKGWILDGNLQSLMDYRLQGKSFELSIPTPEHFLPLLYILALRDQDESVALFNDKIVGGSLSMTSVFID